MKSFLPGLLVVALTLTGCVSAAPRSRAPGSTAIVLPEMSEHEWGSNRCGSGALSTVLNHHGDRVTEEELDERLDKGRNGGVVSIDLLIEAKSRGFDAELLPGDEAMVRRALTEGKPLMLMLRVLDLPRRSRDLFHYIVVDGMDQQRDLVRMQWGRGKPRWASLKRIERAWRATGHATIIVHGRSSERPDGNELLRRAVALQENGKGEAAAALFEQILRDAPSSLVYTNLGNVRREQGDVAGAERAYRAALALEATNRDALNNLAWHLYESKRPEEAVVFARTAAKLDGPDHDLILDTLAEVESALGLCTEATESLARAIDVAPSARKEELTAKRTSIAQKCGAATKAEE